MEKISDKTESSNTHGLPATASSFVFNQSWNLYILKIIFRVDWCTALPIVVTSFYIDRKKWYKSKFELYGYVKYSLQIADCMRLEKRMMEKYVLKEVTTNNKILAQKFECYGNQKKRCFLR